MKTTKKTTIRINAVTSEITMTKTTAQRAGSIGTKEYEQLAQAKRDFPDFTIKITAPKMKKDGSRGLTIDFMEKLIKAMTNNDEQASNSFKAVRELYQNTNFRFSKPKEYFLSQYPDWREWLPDVEQDETETEISPQEISNERNGIFNRRSV